MSEIHFTPLFIVGIDMDIDIVSQSLSRGGYRINTHVTPSGFSFPTTAFELCTDFDCSKLAPVMIFIERFQIFFSRNYYNALAFPHP